MCGRFAMNKETNELIEEFVADGGDFRDWRPSYSIAPTNPILMVRERVDENSGEVRRTIDEAVWDFHPSFMKDSKRPNFNARIETAECKRSARSLIETDLPLAPFRSAGGFVRGVWWR